MTTLDTLQRVFQDYLQHEENHHIETLTAEGHSLPKAYQLEIYFNAYRLRLLEILSGDYPNLFILMGEEVFEDCGLAYIAAHPSHHFSVRRFGQHLSAFLQKTLPYSDSPFFAELADFEWALADTLDAQDALILELDTLKTIPPDKWGFLQFAFHPSLQVKIFAWNTPQLWQAIEKDKERKKETENTNHSLVSSKQTDPLTWILWRHDLQSQYRSLNAAEALMLQILQAGGTFGAACEQLAEQLTLEEVVIPQIALSFIQQCFHDKLITKVFYQD